ncbi:MAG: response regulator [Clostridia bacterium]|nr:response regulator [Clostridia bacterium]
MSQFFSDTLRRLRTEKGLSQQALAEKMYVTRPTVSRWEAGSRLPDALMISRLSEVLGADVNVLLSAVEQSDECPNVIIVDDNKIILSGGLPILQEVMPNASVSAFTKPKDAIEYIKANRVALAFLDIEMGTVSGLDVCREMLKVNPRLNVVYLTAYREYSFDAWSTGACGFMLKPITVEGVREQLNNLRYPFRTGGLGS